MRFNVGDKVRIKKKVQTNKAYDGGCLFVDDMVKYKDMKLTISDIDGSRYHIEEDIDNYYFSDEMLEPFEFKVGDKVEIVRVDTEPIPEKYKKYMDNIFTISQIWYSDEYKKYIADIKEEYTISPFLESLELTKNCKDDIIVSNKDGTVKVNLNSGEIDIKCETFQDLFKKDIYNPSYLGVYPNIEYPKISISTCNSLYSDEIYKPFSISSNDCLSYEFKIPKTYSIGMDIGNNKNEREENFMEILNIYKDRRIGEINKNYDEKYQKIKEADKVQQIIRDTENRLNVLLDRDEDNQVRLYFDDVEKTTQEKFEAIEKEKYNEKIELEKFMKEVKAQLEIAETYETKIEILSNYEVLDENGKINNNDTKTKTNTKKSKK